MLFEAEELLPVAVPLLLHPAQTRAIIAAAKTSAEVFRRISIISTSNKIHKISRSPKRGLPSFYFIVAEKTVWQKF